MKYSKSTKNKHVYSCDNADAVQCIYINKSVLGKDAPVNITITIREDEDGQNKLKK